MTADEFVKGQLALLAWRCGKSAGLNGCLGVALSVRNRVAANLGTWLESIEYGDVFAPTADMPDVRDPQFLQLLQAVDHIYDGTRVDNLTDGATVFRDLQRASYPAEFQRAAQIGNLTFFKAVKA